MEQIVQWRSLDWLVISGVDLKCLGCRNSLPVFLDGVRQIHGLVHRPVQIVQGAVVFGGDGGQIVPGVGADARFGVPPVVASSPRHH